MVSEQTLQPRRIAALIDMPSEINIGSVKSTRLRTLIKHKISRRGRLNPVDMACQMARLSDGHDLAGLTLFRRRRPLASALHVGGCRAWIAKHLGDGARGAGPAACHQAWRRCRASRSHSVLFRTIRRVRGWAGVLSTQRFVARAHGDSVKDRSSRQRPGRLPIGVTLARRRWPPAGARISFTLLRCNRGD